MRPFLALAMLLISLSPLPALPLLRAPMLRYVVSSEVGYRVNPMGGGAGTESLHRGIDMVGPKGCAILAAADGIIVEHWPAPGTRGTHGEIFKGHPTFGGMIVIDHGNGVWTLYGHMSATCIRTGQRVKTGQVIGWQGSTGDATGEHLHWEVIVDPRLFLNSPLGLNDQQIKELLK